MMKVLRKDDYMEVREYPPVKRTILFGGAEYFLSFPRTIFLERKSPAYDYYWMFVSPADTLHHPFIPLPASCKEPLALQRYGALSGDGSYWFFPNLRGHTLGRMCCQRYVDFNTYIKGFWQSTFNDECNFVHINYKSIHAYGLDYWQEQGKSPFEISENLPVKYSLDKYLAHFGLGGF